MVKHSGWIAGLAVLIGAAFVCGSALAADGGVSISPDQRAAGMKATPDLVKAANLACTIADARFIGKATAPNKGQENFYEVACKDGSGYILVSEDKQATPTVYDCLMAAQLAPPGKPNNLACVLPGNAHPALLLQPMLAQSGETCTVDKGRFVGMTTDNTKLYEASCTEGYGYILKAPATSGPPVAAGCLSYAPSSSVRCELTTEAQNLSVATRLAAASGVCTPTNQRWVGSDDTTSYYEVACSDGKGYMLGANKANKLAETISCAKANQLAGGCTLTDARQAMTQQTGVYTDLAKRAGFDCDVSKYADFPVSTADTEVVELACSNRPDGGIGVFPTHGSPKVFDCIRSLAEGYKCSYTPESADYPKLSADLKSMGKGSCVVNGARPYGRTANGDDFIEVSCADGGPGWVIDIQPNGRAQAGDLRNCVQAAALGSGGCQLPTKKS